MEYFKNDDLEQKIIAACQSLFSGINTGIDDLEENCFSCYKMGELLFDNNRMPLTNVIKRDIFIYCFEQIFEAWQFCGTFESYLTVFKKIFGEGSTVDFTVPGAGQLEIEIIATETDEFNAVFREVLNEVYIYDNFVTQDDDKIIFRSVLGIESQYELEKVLFSLVPNGVYTTISLTIT
jgi:hypothetical protein